jgi:hypothetical protein
LSRFDSVSLFGDLKLKPFFDFIFESLLFWRSGPHSALGFSDLGSVYGSSVGSRIWLLFGAKTLIISCENFSVFMAPQTLQEIIHR